MILNKQIIAVVFDLDGVLIDSAKDIASAVNNITEKYMFGRLPEENVVNNVGLGAAVLLKKCIEELREKADGEVNRFDVVLDDEERFAEVYEAYLAYYAKHCLVQTTLYPGTFECLNDMKTEGIKLGVLTNKPINVTDEVLKGLDILQFFDSVVGPEHLKRMKPDKEGYLLSLTNMGLSTSIVDKTMMVGDSGTDIMTGRAAGAKTCAVTYGIGNKEKLFAQNADFLANSFQEIQSFVEKIVD